MSQKEHVLKCKYYCKYHNISSIFFLSSFFFSCPQILAFRQRDPSYTVPTVFLLAWSPYSHIQKHTFHHHQIPFLLPQASSVHFKAHSPHKAEHFHLYTTTVPDIQAHILVMLCKKAQLEKHAAYVHVYTLIQIIFLLVGWLVGVRSGGSWGREGGIWHSQWQERYKTDRQR